MLVFMFYDIVALFIFSGCLNGTYMRTVKLHRRHFEHLKIVLDLSVEIKCQ